MPDYEDILHLPHHVSSRHPQMPMEARAAQFASFKALSGYEDELAETGRLTDRRPELEEDRKEELDWQLRTLREELATGAVPVIEITWFRPDERKAGGAILTATGPIQQISDTRRTILLRDTLIPMDDILEIRL